MAKAKNNKSRLQPSLLSQEPAVLDTPPPTGEAIPTPDCLSTRKSSIHVQSKLATGASP